MDATQNVNLDAKSHPNLQIRITVTSGDKALCGGEL